MCGCAMVAVHAWLLHTHGCCIFCCLMAVSILHHVPFRAQRVAEEVAVEDRDWTVKKPLAPSTAGDQGAKGGAAAPAAAAGGAGGDKGAAADKVQVLGWVCVQMYQTPPLARHTVCLAFYTTQHHPIHHPTHPCIHHPTHHQQPSLLPPKLPTGAPSLTTPNSQKHQTRVCRHGPLLPKPPAQSGPCVKFAVSSTS